MLLASDTFNRVAGTLGPDWSEQGGTNMSCDGSFARIDSSSQAHIALLAGTSQRDTYFQCWMRGSDASNLVGLCWRFQNTTNYYTVRGNNSVYSVFRVGGTGGTVQIGGSVGTVGGLTTWKRITVRHVGTRIQIYIDNLYDLFDIGGPNERDGPFLDRIDTDTNGSAWTGLCGTVSATNNVDGITNLQWNDFAAFDGGAETIYVDTAFNGGAAGEGMGTVDRPDNTLQHALNNAGLNVQGKIKLQSTALEANGATPKFSIGHGGKFGRSAYSFPTYDDANGQVISAGDPNLTIEGRDGGRSVLRENAGSHLFNLRSDAKGILFRGFDFELTGAVSSTAVRTSGHDGGGAGDHSFAVHKCRFDLNANANTIDRVILITGTQTLVDLRYNYVRFNSVGVDSYLAGSGATAAILALRTRMNVFDHRLQAEPNTGNIGVIAARTGTAGIRSVAGIPDTWDIDHNTFLEVRSAGADDNALSLWTAADVDGDVEFQNNIVYGQSVGEPTGFGVRVAAGAITGTVRAHHNGYFRVTTQRSAQVTNQGNEVDSTDPEWTDPSTGTTFTWQHTAGSGLFGEGTFSPITIQGDFRPTNAAYLDSADDSNPLLGVLDRGALQSYAVVVPSSPSLPPEEPEQRIFCTSVIFDPGGPQEYDLSVLLLEANALRYERDILLRSYRASDVMMVFADKNSLFVESNPNSFLLGADGQPDWLGKRVVITAIFGTDSMAQYEGFVLEVEAAQGVGRLRIGNRFQQLFDRPVLANDVVRIVATNNEAVHPRYTGDVATAGYHGRDGIVVHLENRPPVEVLTFEFTSPTAFFVTGSVSGYEGEGSIDSAFTTLSGSLTITGGDQEAVHSGTAVLGGSSSIYLDPGASAVDDAYNTMTIFLTGGTGAGQVRIITDYDASAGIPPFNKRATVDQPWTTIPDSTTTFDIFLTTPQWNGGAHVYAVGEKVQITLGWASTVPLSNPPSNDPDRRILDIYRDFLLSPQGGQLVAGDLDPSVAAMETERGNQQARPFVVDRPRTAIDVVDELSLHMGTVTIEKSNAKIGLRKFTPQLIAAGSLDMLCSGDDLMATETAHLPIYNQFVFSYDYDVATNEFRSGFVFPDRKEDNRSLERYDRLYPAPRPFEARAYSPGVSGNTQWLELLAAVLYRRYENPALVAKVKTKVSRMGAELDDTYRLDSEAPTMQIEAMEPFAIDKNVTGGLTVDMDLVDVSAIVQEAGACGFLSYDTPGQGYDQCWGYF